MAATTPIDLDALVIDPEFRDLVDEPAKDQYERLEQRLVQEGYNPNEKIEVWDGHDIVVDGHTRLSICKKHGIPVPQAALTRIAFPSREAVGDYIITKQLARRNLNPARYRYFVGLLYKREKGRAGVAAGGSADEKVAKRVGTSARTVRRSEKFAEAVDKLDADAKKAVLSGRARVKVKADAPPAKKKAKQGAVRFAWGETARAIGSVVRVPDKIKDAYGDTFKEDEHAAMVQLMREFTELFEKARKRLAK